MNIHPTVKETAAKISLALSIIFTAMAIFGTLAQVFYVQPYRLSETEKKLVIVEASTKAVGEALNRFSNDLTSVKDKTTSMEIRITKLETLGFENRERLARMEATLEAIKATSKENNDLMRQHVLKP